MDRIVYQVDSAQAERLFAQLLERSINLAPVMADIGEVWLENTWSRFDRGVGPDGIAWEPLADGSGDTPLHDSGRMRNTMFPSSGPDWVSINASARQARWHQEGTKPYEIRAKNGKALFWPGMGTRSKADGSETPAFVSKVNHPGLPARPFIGFGPEDEAATESLVAAWLELDENPASG